MVACGGWIVSQAFDLGCKNRPFRPGSGWRSLRDTRDSCEFSVLSRAHRVGGRSHFAGRFPMWVQVWVKSLVNAG